MTSEEILEKVNKIKDEIKDSAAYILFFNTDIAINSSTSFIVWDDANMLIYAISESNIASGANVIDQARLPYKIKALPYQELVLATTLYDSSPNT